MVFDFLRGRQRVEQAAKTSVSGDGGDASSYIDVSVVTVGELFSDTYSLRLPWFQRAYAWQEDHVGRLLTDIHDAMKSEKKRYFLGQIRVANPKETGFVSLIDGQQRLLTLTILFALLRDFATAPEEKEIADRAIRFSPAGNGRAHAPAYRIVPQEQLERFFVSHVQAPGGTLTDPATDERRMVECERYVFENRNHLKAQLLDLLPKEEQRRKLLTFVLENCHLLVVGVVDEEEAWSMLSIEEETGLAFHSSERSKISLLSVMPRDQQEEAGKIWEQCQMLVGADALCNLLRFVRSIKQRSRSTKPVEKELAQLFELNQDGLGPIKEELLVRAQHLAQIQKLEMGGPDCRERVSLRLKALLWFDYTFWVPPVLHWLKERGHDHSETESFVEKIERLAWVLRVSGADPTTQERRFIAVINDIDAHESPDDMPVLAIENRSLRAALKNLRGKTFYSKHYSGPVLRLLSLRLGGGAVDTNELTIEHILPRNPPKSGSWRKVFSSPSAIGDAVNRLGNLVLLPNKVNQLAGTNDYEVKRALFADSGHVLASNVADDCETWTRDEINARTEKMIQVLLDDWKLEEALIA